MSDNEMPQIDPESGGSGGDASKTTAVPAAATPAVSSAAAPPSITTPAVPSAETSAVAAEPPPSAISATDDDEGASGRRAQAPRVAGPIWLAAALVCLIAGVLASVLGARAVARNEAADARNAFQRTSTSISSTLNVAIRHEEQLTVSAVTFFAERPRATQAEFAKWQAWARTHTRYPELDALGFVPLAQASPARLRSRDAATSVRTAVASSRGPALAVETPVYRGATTPRSLVGRRAADVGWLRAVFVPGVVLGDALTGQSGYAAAIHYGSTGALAYTSGAPQAEAQSTSIPLHGGWRLTSYGPQAGESVWNDLGALALLIGGILASGLLALVLVLGGKVGALGRALPAAPVPRAPSAPDRDVAREELHDPLTGLANRVLMMDRAERLIARTGRQSETVAGALFVEVDWVTDVNDRLGREAGDELLRVVAQRLEHVIRAGDSVGRVGGDEFVILVESAARGVRLDSLARRVIEALHEPVELAGFGLSFVLSTSVGIAFGRYETPGELLGDAQQAAKAAGRDRYTLFNANTRTTTEGRDVRESELGAALQDGQLFLLYEPICDLAERRVVGLQALLRWRHPERGVLEPAEFVPLARETDLIVPIGRWQLEQACARAAAWNVAGRHGGVSVRVSAEQLNRESFVTDVRRALQMSGLEPELLTLDVSEQTVIGDLAPGAERLHELKRLGVSLALDDFGSRYASHADLQQLPLDCLKVDRCSIAASDTEDYRSWLLETILVAGRDLALPVIVRGVDAPAQLETLWAMGATILQGALFADPAPAESAERLLLITPPQLATPGHGPGGVLGSAAGVAS